MDDKIKLAIVGLRFGSNLFATEYFGQGAADEYFQLRACCDIDKDKADCYAKEYNLTAYYDIDMLLEQSDAQHI